MENDAYVCVLRSLPLKQGKEVRVVRVEVILEIERELEGAPAS